jgi:hypothetical protein
MFTPPFSAHPFDALPMKRTPLAFAAVVLALAASPLAAQPVITGFDNLHWGATRDSVQRYWRETPRAESRQGEWAFLQFADWQSMQWTVTVHDQLGFQQFYAKSLMPPTDRRCQGGFERYAERIRRLYGTITPQGGVNNPGGGNLCEAVAAGRATAVYTWTDPANNAIARVFIDPADGRMVHMQAGAPFVQFANAQAASAPAQPTQPAPAAQAGRLTGYDSRVWDPQAPAVQLPFGTPADEIRRRYGRPFREDSDDVGPGMTDILYTDNNGGGLVFTVHRTDGLVRVINSTGLSVPDLPCNEFWARARDRVAARFPGVTPRGGAHNPRGGNLCEQVQAGNAFAEMVWADPAGGPTVWLRVGPSTGVISIATASPQFHQWFDTSPLGRERWERVRRAGGGR